MRPEVGTTPERVLEAEQRLAEIDPGYLTRARNAAARLGLRPGTTTSVQAAFEAIEELSVIDLDVPTASRIPAARTLKKVVKRLVGWYLGYFGRQVSAFGQAVANMGGLLLERTEQVESDTAALKAEVAQLAERVERLERHPGSA